MRSRSWQRKWRGFTKAALERRAEGSKSFDGLDQVRTQAICAGRSDRNCLSRGLTVNWSVIAEDGRRRGILRWVECASRPVSLVAGYALAILTITVSTMATKQRTSVSINCVCTTYGGTLLLRVALFAVLVSIGLQSLSIDASSWQRLGATRAAAEPDGLRQRC
jgi:hypothetical protein